MQTKYNIEVSDSQTNTITMFFNDFRKAFDFVKNENIGKGKRLAISLK